MAQHVGVDRARHDLDDADPLQSQLGSQRLAQRADGRLTGPVRGIERHRRQDRRRSEVADHAAARVAQQRDRAPGPLELWREMFETNVFGLVEATRRAIPLMREAGGGVICNMGSSSILAPVPFYAAYRASKAAVSALSETLRAELAPLSIRVV
ncbi:MAG TPA: SDR family NAD(P)-dependent oxidoreductase, partial [Acidimicrobiia bacterium]|nr:SDR family NAD(P)-dependent oxidoreductase [Acidimicrobiia bacterium]